MKSFKNYLKPAKAKQTEQTTEKTSPQNGPAISGGASIMSGTPRHSRPASLFPEGDFRNSAIDEIIDIKCDVMVNWLHQQQLESMWSSGGPGEGVVLKKSRGNFTCCPSDLAETSSSFYDAIRALNVRVSTKIDLESPMC
jgi:hypothetical protein